MLIKSGNAIISKNELRPKVMFAHYKHLYRNVRLQDVMIRLNYFKTTSILLDNYD